MSVSTSELETRFLESFAAFKEAFSFSQAVHREKLLSHIDALARSPNGIQFIYEQITALAEAGIFNETVWQRPDRLVPGLVNGTLLAGHPSSTLEVLSELRLQAIAEGRLEHEKLTRDGAHQFLVTAMVACFDLVFEEFNDRTWDIYPAGELQKIRSLFDWLVAKIPVDQWKEKLEEEVITLIAHRPISPHRLEKMLRVAGQSIQLDEHRPEDQKLQGYIQSFLSPTSLTRQTGSPDAYAKILSDLSSSSLLAECRQIGREMVQTGLVSPFQQSLLDYLITNKPELVPELLQLDAHGRAEYERHQAFVRMLVEQLITPASRHAIFGLAKMLERNLLSRQITWNAVNRLLRVELHPEIAVLLHKSNHSDYPATPIQLLIGGIISVLGHPLGVRQGNNPTCQSARAISMWSRHAPGKLINLLIDAASASNIAFRFEGEVIESAQLVTSLIKRFDYKLDPVSVVLVPHLDKIYNTMMERAALKHLGKDPHVSVNPAFYGHWIQTGFTSVYNSITGRIEGFKDFVRIFYASFHPQYNGGHHLIYPVPLGIFITDANANMRGFHAVSLLRIERDADNEWRVYFFNPNSEGRQRWGQGISPSVTGWGEEPGESSLPVFQFVARVYAFHYNSIRLGDKPAAVPESEVRRIEHLARTSWGQKYQWLDVTTNRN